MEFKWGNNRLFQIAELSKIYKSGHVSQFIQMNLIKLI